MLVFERTATASRRSATRRPAGDEQRVEKIGTRLYICEPLLFLCPKSPRVARAAPDTAKADQQRLEPRETLNILEIDTNFELEGRQESLLLY